MDKFCLHSFFMRNPASLSCTPSSQPKLDGTLTRNAVVMRVGAGGGGHSADYKVLQKWGPDSVYYPKDMNFKWFPVSGFIAPSLTHSRVERIMRIASNGTMIGAPGYERAHVVRGTIPEDDIVWLLPPNGRADGKVIHLDDKIANPRQRTASYSDQFGPVKAAPGDFVALPYQENGHVTKPSAAPFKPLNSGTVYVYGTLYNGLRDADLVDVHLAWTSDGTGGNQKGTPIATRNYDDGQCYQINSGPISLQRQKEFSKAAEDPMGQDLWCRTDIQIPCDTPVGATYTVIWVWDWPTMSASGIPVPPASFHANDTNATGPYVTSPQLYTSILGNHPSFHSSGSATRPDVQIVHPECGIEASGCREGVGLAGYVNQTNMNLAANRAQLGNLFQVAM
ncbi:hypothetical protein F5X98DRAFT_381632 [Xylaria grammica]|nr:hypothetical protein F5X98DRAFT_381632 [Xylaria grammica]